MFWFVVVRRAGVVPIRIDGRCAHERFSHLHRIVPCRATCGERREPRGDTCHSGYGARASHEKRPLSSHGTVRSEHGPVTPLEETDARAPFALFDDASRLGFGHRGQVVDVAIALATESNPVVAVHGLPRCPARAGNTKLELGIRWHIGSDARGAKTI